jgi:3-methyl-2-oxobutanoate hydroxymethyltransferase
MKNTIATLQAQNTRGDKITMLTAYDYSTAKLMDEAGIECLLVGDSLGMVVLGYEDTLSVTLEDIIHHTRAVKRGARNAFIVADMPFMSYHISPEQALENAGRLIKEGGAHAIKLEGGVDMVPAVEKISKASIPVVGHIGLTPQSVNAFGGFKVQGKSIYEAKKLIEDALALENAGLSLLVLEAIPAKLAKIITTKLTIPTIGIGAGTSCDGQVLVYQDMLGLYGNISPKFVKQYANLGSAMKKAFSEYIDEVRASEFPSDEHSFKTELTDEELASLL